MLVFSFGCVTSGILRSWAATSEFPGLNLLTEISEKTASRVADDIAPEVRRGRCIGALGSSSGLRNPGPQRRFAHALIDRTNVSVIHGHSSHHPAGHRRLPRWLILYHNEVPRNFW